MSASLSNGLRPDRALPCLSSSPCTGEGGPQAIVREPNDPQPPYGPKTQPEVKYSGINELWGAYPRWI